LSKLKAQAPVIPCATSTASKKYYEPYRKEIANILGEDCFIQKPITNEGLLKMVNTIVKDKANDATKKVEKEETAKGLFRYVNVFVV
jgi:hypothetical protein